jgi:anti-sigma regulatory factor (Ser/Thr protein kinase)
VTVEAEAMRAVRKQVEAFARQRGFDRAQVGDLSLAVAEALFNAMEHGSSGSGSVKLEIDYAGGSLEIAVEDDGGIDSREQAQTRVAQMREVLARECTGGVPEADLERGRGLFLIRARMDQVRVECAGQHGVRMIMVKRR